ncbi:MAG: DUF1330 domain-containing protein, partial [Pseudomonadota bacterium]
HITVHNPERYKDYVVADTPIFEKFGARFLVRGGESEVAEGTFKERHVVIEFDSFEQAKACYESAEYQEVAKIRREASEGDILLVAGT